MNKKIIRILLGCALLLLVAMVSARGEKRDAVLQEVCLCAQTQVEATGSQTAFHWPASDGHHFRDDFVGTCQESAYGARTEYSRVKTHSVFAGTFSFSCAVSGRFSMLTDGETPGESPVWRCSRFYITKFRNLRI